MRGTVVTLACMALLAGQASGQRPGGAIWEILDNLGSHEGKPPALQDVFADIGRLLKGVDKSKVDVLEVRAAEIEEEVRHLENLQSALERGIVVDLPGVLKERTGVEASPTALEREQRQVDELRAQERFLKERERRQAIQQREGEVARSERPTRLGSAALEVAFNVPEPRKTITVTAESVQNVVDRASLGKALYFAGDFQAALIAFEKLTPDELTNEIKFRMACCHDRLGLWDRAKELYGVVQAADPKGHWGRQATWSIDLGQRRQRIRSLMGPRKERGKAHE